MVQFSKSVFLQTKPDTTPNTGGRRNNNHHQHHPHSSLLPVAVINMRPPTITSLKRVTVWTAIKVIFLVTLSIVGIKYYTRKFCDIDYYLEFLESFNNTCGKPRWVKDPRMHQWLPKVNVSDYPVFLINARSMEYLSPVIEPLQAHNISYTVFQPPTPSPERLVQFGRDPQKNKPLLINTCRITLAHRDILQKAFEHSPASTSKSADASVIIMEDDAILHDYNELKTVIAYYEYAQLPFYSLYRTEQRCVKYNWGTQAYVIRRSFYEALLYGRDTQCLGTCEQPIDKCLSWKYDLQKTQATVFLHNSKIASMKFHPDAYQKKKGAKKTN
jgi:hypothetical protein